MVPRGSRDLGVASHRKRAAERPRPACSVARCDTPISSRRGLVSSLPAGSTVASVRRGRSTVVGVDPGGDRAASGGSAGFAALDALTPGFWVGWCAFELGHALERVVARGGVDSTPRRCPTSVFARFDALAVVDPSGGIAVRGDGAGRGCSSDALATWPAPGRSASRVPASARGTASLDRDATSSARRRPMLELLRAGECYQVNLTRRLTCDDALDPVASVRRARRAQPGAARRAAAASELGAADRGRVGVARALPARATAATSRRARSRAPPPTRAALRRERQGPRRERDDRRPRPQRPRPRVRVRARSTVPALCAVEAHPGPVPPREHGARAGCAPTSGSATLRARRRSRPRRSPARRSRASCRRSRTSSRCAAASTAARSAGSTPTRGAGELAVAIRTFTIVRRPHRTSASAAGIVADSRPDAEWAETELKARAPARGRGRRRATAPDVGAIRDDRLGRRRARRRSTTRASRRSTTGCSSATACSRRSASTTACRSRGAATSTGSRTRPPGLGLDRPDRRRRCAPRPTRCSRPTASREARLRITVTGGAAPLGSARRRRAARRSIVAASRVAPVAPTIDVVVVVPWTRNERGALAGLKTISYAENVRALAYAAANAARARRSSPTPAATCARRPAPTCSSCATACCVTPPRSAGCLLGVTRALVLELARELGIAVDERDAADRRARATPTRRSSRRRRARCSRSRTSTAARCPSRPGPVADRAAPTAFTRARRPRPRPLARRSVDHVADVAEVDDVAGGDGVRRAVVVAHDEVPVVGDVDRGRRRASSSRAARPAPAGRASPSARAVVVDHASSSAVERARRARSRNASSSASRSTARPASRLHGGRDRRQLGGERVASSRCSPMPDHDGAVAVAPRPGCPASLRSSTTRSLGHFSPASTPATCVDRVGQRERRPPSRAVRALGRERRAAAAPTPAATTPAAPPTCGRAGPGPRSGGRRRPRGPRARRRAASSSRYAVGRVDRRRTAERRQRRPVPRCGRIAAPP